MGPFTRKPHRCTVIVIKYNSVRDSAAQQQHDKAERLGTTELMSNAANAAAATPLPFRRVRNRLKCTKKGGPEQ